MNTKKKELVFIIIILVILVFIALSFKKNNLRSHCLKAICNEDYTICYTYSDNGRTMKSWQGNCSQFK